MTGDERPGGGPPEVPGLDPGLARSAGLGSIGPAPAGAGPGAGTAGPPARATPRPKAGRSATPERAARRHLVVVAVCAAAAIAVVVGGLSLTSGGTHPSATAPSTPAGAASVSAAAGTAAGARSATAVAAYVKNLQNITSIASLAATGTGSISGAMNAWNQIQSDAQGLSSAAHGIPGSSAVASDAQAVVNANSVLTSAVTQFEQDPTSQSAIDALKTSMTTSAGATAQVERDLGITMSGSQAIAAP